MPRSWDLTRDAEHVVVVVSSNLTAGEFHHAMRLREEVIAVQVTEWSLIENFPVACSLVGLDPEQARDTLLARLGIAGCYSHRDAYWLSRLQVHLKPLQLHVWSDRRIELGDNWHREITKASARAKAALVLVSADSLASDHISSEELPRLLAAAQEGGCRIIPVLVGPSLFHATPALSRFQGVPARPTSSELPPADGERVLAELAGRLAELFG